MYTSETITKGYVDHFVFSWDIPKGLKFISVADLYEKLGFQFASIDCGIPGGWIVPEDWEFDGDPLEKIMELGELTYTKEDKPNKLDIINTDKMMACRDCEFLCHNYCFKLKRYLSVGQIMNCGCNISDNESENEGESNA